MTRYEEKRRMNEGRLRSRDADAAHYPQLDVAARHCESGNGTACIEIQTTYIASDTVCREHARSQGVRDLLDCTTARLGLCVTRILGQAEWQLVPSPPLGIELHKLPMDSLCLSLYVLLRPLGRLTTTFHEYFRVMSPLYGHMPPEVLHLVCKPEW